MQTLTLDHEEIFKRLNPSQDLGFEAYGAPAYSKKGQKPIANGPTVGFQKEVKQDKAKGDTHNYA
jgi:hypothetical protein